MPLLLTGYLQHATSIELSQQKPESNPSHKRGGLPPNALRYPVAVINEKEALNNSLYWLLAIGL